MLRVLAALLLVASAAGAETHRLKPAAGHPTFAVRPPVLTVKPGDVLESETLWGEWYEKPGGKWPGEVGPVRIESAEPGDTLVVEILKVRPNRDTAVSTQGGRFGALVPDSGTAMLNEPFPRGRYVWRLDRERMTGTVDLPGSALKSVTVPLRPMLGRVAVAPQGDEAFDGLWPGNFGGNMDASDVREGTTVYLPVFHEGALFYFGDGHALQGDGEVCGSGLETSMDVAFRFGLQKKKPIAWPRLEDAEYLMVAGSARPLSDALRIAFVELIGWLVTDHGFDRADAYQLVSQLAVVRVANMVDPLYTVVAKFPKRFLPGGRPSTRSAEAPRLLAEALKSGKADVDVAAALVQWVLFEQPEKLAPALADALRVVSPGSSAAEVEPWGAAARTVVSLMAELLKDAESHRRREGESTLADLAPAFRVAAPEVVKALKDAEPAVRKQLLLTLRLAAPALKGAVPSLMNALGDSEAAVRLGAATALGALGPAARAAVPALKTALADPQAAVREAAAEALRRIEAN